MPETPAVVPRSGIARFFNAMQLPVGDPFALAGLIIYGFFFVMAVFAPLIAPYDPIEILYTSDYDLASDLFPGERGHILGTTSLGRDIFSQIVWGARSALLVGLTAAFMVAFIGSVVGLLAGYFGGWVDAVLMRLADIAFGIPFLHTLALLVPQLTPVYKRKWHKRPCTREHTKDTRFSGTPYLPEIVVV
jgi:peptide/nickel transport system permease protein